MTALNAGALAPTFSAGGTQYLKDQFFQGGDVLRTEEYISGTSEPSLYQTARYGNVTYKFANLPCGEYFIDLHFAEIVFAVGPSCMRVFDVHIQDEKVRGLFSLMHRLGLPYSPLCCKHKLKVQEISYSYNSTKPLLDLDGSRSDIYICNNHAPHLLSRSSLL